MILRRNGYVRHEPCPVLGANDNDNDNNNKNINEVELKMIQSSIKLNCILWRNDEQIPQGLKIKFVKWVFPQIDRNQWMGHVPTGERSSARGDRHGKSKKCA